MRDEFKRDAPFEVDIAQAEDRIGSLPLMNKPDLLKGVLREHPGLFTFVGKLAVESKGRLFDYHGKDITDEIESIAREANESRGAVGR
jgi:hypothetical protein